MKVTVNNITQLTKQLYWLSLISTLLLTDSLQFAVCQKNTLNKYNILCYCTRFSPTKQLNSLRKFGLKTKTVLLDT